MTKLGIILCWELSDQDKQRCKKKLIQRYLKDYNSLEEFLEDNLREYEEVHGYKSK